MMEFLLRKQHARTWSMLVTMLMLVQVLTGALSPMLAHANASETATSVADGEITFRLPTAGLDLKVNGTFNEWGAGAQHQLLDADNDGTYTATVSGLVANQEYSYKYTLGSEWLVDPELKVTADENGSITFNYTPKFYVFGSFDNNWSTRQEMTLQGNVYTYTTAELPAGDYEYKYIAKPDNIGEIYFRDPTNTVTANGNSKITVPGEVTPPPTDGSDIQPDVFVDQPGGKSKFVLAGTFQASPWSPAATDTQLKHLAGDFYALSLVLDAGNHQFKIVKNGDWNQGFSNGGNNFSFDLTQKTKVNFYVNEATGQARISIPNVQGLQLYTPLLTADKWPRLVGTVQTALGEAAEWSPSTSQLMFVDYNFDNTVYKIQRSFPAGNFKAKVTFGANWDENYGDASGQDVSLVTLDPTDVTFTIDYSQAQRVLTHDYKPSDGKFDGQIKGDKLYFNSRTITYKKPFGAIPEGTQDLTLRIAAERDDVQIARVELIDGKGLAKSYDMKKATTVGEQDFFEVTIPKTAFQGIGIWGYKFILVDGSTKVEYGDDKNSGGTGAVAEEGVLPYNLTVYKNDFQTPDWMKHAVVYQIFPDRFFDGNKSNNRAKLLDGYRGPETVSGTNVTAKNGYRLQFFDGGVPNDPAAQDVWGNWSDVPEMPDRVLNEQQKPYYPWAKTDGVWTNEFYGGDIQGVEQKIDYLKSIGVNVIYFNPVAWAASNHKYDATDYKHLDPMFGEPVYNTPGDPTSGLNYDETRKASDKVFIDFAKAARAAGIKMIVDGVFNHVGDDSIYFDRYEKYPEIGAYEYWKRVWDKVNDQGKTQAVAEQEVRAYYTSQINPATGQNYQDPADFEYTTWFTINNKKIRDRDGKTVYEYDPWWDYHSLPEMDAKEPQDGDAGALPGAHEYNIPGYRDQIIGHNLTGVSDQEADAKMQEAVSQRWNWMGARGWRLDVAPDVSQGTWQKFRESVKSITGRSDANGEPIDDPIILGEEWGVATHYLLGDQFDSVMNYQFRAAMQNFIISGNAQEFHEALERIRENYPKEAWEVMLNLVDSHDTTRSITKYEHPDWEEEKFQVPGAPSNKALEDQALTAIFQMSYPGAPTIYYGDEVGLTGTKDPDSRRTFPWERVTGSNGQYAGVDRYGKLFDSYQKAADARHNNEVFRTGDLHLAYAQGDVIAYARKNDTKAGLTVINRSNEAKTIEANVAGFLPDGLTLQDQLFGASQATTAGGKITVTVPARSGLMMVSTEDMTVVPAVSNLTASAGNQSVQLTWDAVPDATGYNVYRSAIEGGAVEKLGSVTETQFTDTDVVNGKKYYYAVTAQMGTSEGLITNMVSATPSFPISSVVITEPAGDMTIGVGKKTAEIAVTIDVPGLTDDASLAGKEATNLIARLVYYMAGTNKTLAFDTKLRYKSDTADGKKVYTAAFEPTEAGAYQYFAKVSTDNGDHFTESAEAVLQTQADSSDTTAPTAVALEDIKTESNRVQLKWTVANNDATGIEIYRKTAETGYQKIATLDQTALEYIDFTVSNDTAYTYKVVTFDQAYNRAESAEKSVTPKLVMIDVTLRLHLPGYTPTSDDIYIAGSLNGWDAKGGKLTVPSGATSRDVVEYTFKMMAGKRIEYKYTRGSWSTEAFTSHTRVPNDTTDYGNWAYSSTDTNMQLTIKNDGDNKMLVEDYVLRWVDMPMMVALPRTSYGDKIVYSTSEDFFKLKAVVPFGVQFTINGQPIPAEAMDALGNVQIDRIPLNPGLNRFSLHIEPTAETLAQPWYTDKGRASQATKTIEMEITRTTGGTTPTSPVPTNPTPTEPTKPTQPPVTGSQVRYSVEQIKTIVQEAVRTGTVTIDLKDKFEALLPVNLFDLLGDQNSVEIKTGEASAQIPVNQIEALQALIPAEQRANSEISFAVQPLSEAAKAELLEKAKATGNVELTAVGEVYDFNLAIKTQDGKTTKLSTFTEPITLKLKVSPRTYRNLAGVYYIGDNGELEYVGGKIEGGVMTAKVSHFSSYAVLEYNKTFGDVAANHWASNVIKEMAAKHVISGVTGSTFEPDRSVTRAEFAAMVVRALGLQATGTTKFADVQADAWYASAVAAAFETGIVAGRNDTTFAPNDRITRQEMAAMIVRAYALQSDVAIDLTATTSFADDVQISTWAKGAVQAAAKAGLINGRGDNQFAPQGLTTRAESAQVIWSLLNK